MKLRHLGLLALLAVSACSTDSLLSPSERNSLSEARAKWIARPFANYTYEIERLCFCPPEINAWTRVTVHGGAVVAAEPVVPNPGGPPLTLTYWEPIDSLFTQILESAHTGNSVYQDIDVKFDRTLGFPTEIIWRERSGVADAGSVVHVRNVKAN